MIKPSFVSSPCPQLMLLSFTLVVLLIPNQTAANPTPLCPLKYSDLPKAEQKSGVTCRCTQEMLESQMPNPSTKGAPPSLWGSEIYTVDSFICAAARHMGLIGAYGGNAEVKPAPGCWGYIGSTRHGVTSARWTSFRASFFFPELSQGRCPPLSKVTTGQADAAAAARFVAGDQVKCRWKDGKSWYTGKVNAKNPKDAPGYLMITYDDGDREIISPSLCRRDVVDASVTGQPNTELAKNFQLQQRVKCLWRHGNRRYPGTIIRNQSGVLTVKYDDGAVEHISPELCK